LAMAPTFRFGALRTGKTVKSFLIAAASNVDRSSEVIEDLVI
jgi:hypothetical protein